MKFLEGKTVGIDLGTTYSAIAHLNEDGEPEVIENADGRPITPSVVLLDAIPQRLSESLRLPKTLYDFLRL